MVSDDAAKDAQRNILTNWTKLSAGDASTVQAALGQREATVVTTPDSPHWYFWTQLVRLTWAEDVKPPAQMAALPVRLACFRLTDFGRESVPRFIAHWKLFEMTTYNNAPKGQKPRAPIVPDQL